MERSDRDSTRIASRLSSLIRDPIVREAFQRAERDYGQTFAIPDEPPAVLDGGAAERVDELEVVS
jgi:hypothetical protein